MKNKFKLFMPILATTATLGSMTIGLTSCSNKKADLKAFMEQYDKFLNNYRNGANKDYRYDTTDLGKTLKPKLVADGAEVEITAVKYDSVQDKIYLVNDKVGDLVFNTIDSVEFSYDLKIAEMISKSHEYTITNEEITVTLKDSDDFEAIISYNKDGYLTHMKTDTYELTIQYTGAPTKARYEQINKFILKYKEIYNLYRFGFYCYSTEDIGKSLNGTFKKEGQAEIQLSAMAFTFEGNKETATFNTETFDVTPALAPAALLTKLSEFDADDKQYIMSDDTIGFVFKKSGSVVYSCKYNKNGYITEEKHLDNDSLITVSMTYSKDPENYRGA